MRKKILILIESLNVGGAEKALLSLLRLIDYSRYDVTLLLISYSGGFIGELKNIKEVTVKWYIKPSSSNFLSFINALKIKAIYKWLPGKIVGNYFCKGYDVAIAYCEGNLTKWVGASSLKIGKIAWVHTDMISNDWPVATGVFPDKDSEDRAYSKFNAIVCVSNYVADGMRHRIDSSNICTIYNILDPEIIVKSKSEIELVKKHKLNLVSVGRLEYVKGYDLLVDAIDELVNKRHIDVLVSIVGDGSQGGHLKQKVSNLGLSENVIFIGAQSNPYPYMLHADAFICSSRHDGFNIAILEAMKLGKPIVSTSCIGPQEILDWGKNGILCEISAHSIADGIEKLLSKDALQYYAHRAQIRSLDFNPDRQMSLIENLLDSLLT